MTNPKSHDSLMKWLITSFTHDFFAHYFPEIKTGQYTFIDKEFISKYEALKESLKGDLFIAIEIEINGHLQEVVIHIEHQSARNDVSKRVYEYHCYAWLLKSKHVWSIVIYTDDAVWRKPVADKFGYGFDSRNKEQFYHFDVIKIKSEKSSDLIKKRSLMCKLLALKANDKESNPEELVRDILKTVSEMSEQLNDDIKLLVLQWVDLYKKISPRTLDKIKKEVKMNYVASTITEHYKYQGKVEGRVEGKVEALEGLYKEGILTEDQYKQKVIPLKNELSGILSQNHAGV